MYVRRFGFEYFLPTLYIEAFICNVDHPWKISVVEMRAIFLITLLEGLSIVRRGSSFNTYIELKSCY